jgi:hypothetical protein
MEQSLGETSNQLDWWWNRVRPSEDWASLDDEVKTKYAERIQQVMIDLAGFSIGKQEICELVEITDVTTVFDAILGVWAIPPEERGGKYQLLAYLRRCIVSSWKGRRIAEPESYYKEPPTRERKKVANLEYVQKYSPFNFSNKCSVCGEKLGTNNKSGICTECRKKRPSGLNSKTNRRTKNKRPKERGSSRKVSRL